MKGLFFITTLSVLLALVSGQPAFPQFVLEPVDTVQSSGGTVTLTCNVTFESGGVSYSWSYNGVRINGSSGRRYQFTLSEQTEGQYACLASVSTGTLSSRLATVKIAKFESHSLPQNEPTAVGVGEAFSLSCNSFSSIGAATVTWSRVVAGGITLPLNSGEVLGIKDSQIYIPYATSNLNGQYKCLVNNPASGEAIQGSYSITVSGSTTSPQPQVLSRPENTTVPVGRRAVFQCIPTGESPTAVSWTRPARNQNYVEFAGGLLISSVDFDDAGEYACNVNGMMYSAYLTVVGPPSISTQSPNVSVPYGNTLSLQCTSEQYGSPQWTWYRNGEKITTDVRSKVSGNSLTVSSVVLRDSGFYQCVSSDVFGQYGSAMVEVSVKVIPPSFTDPSELQDMVVFEGDNIELKCSVYSAPPSTFKWSRNSVQLTSSLKFDTNTSGKLVIANITRGDQGMYKCEATSMLPETSAVVGTQSHERELQVIQPTTFTNSLPALIYRQVKDDPQEILLPCVAQGDTLANISYQWYRDNEPFDPPGGLASNTVGTFRLVNWDISDSGLYQCVVSTTITNFTSGAPKTIETTANVTIAVAPAAPSRAVGTTRSSTAVGLRWEYNGDAAFIRSIVIYKQVVGTSAWEYVGELADSSVLSYEVDNLFPFTNYSFRILVVDEKQQMAHSVSSYFATFEAAPTAPPISLGSEHVNSSSLRVFWRPPPLRNTDGSGRNGIVTGYEVRYAAPDSDFTTYSFETVGGSQTEIYLAGRAYLVAVAARNSQGLGPFSAPTLLDGTPGGPTDGPFYQSVWFIVVVCVGGVLLLAFVFVVICVCCVCWKRGKSRSFEVNNFHGGNQPHFDVYQYEMEKTTRLRSIRAPQEGVPDQYDLYQADYSNENGFMMQDGYPPITDQPNYIPPPSFYQEDPHLLKELEGVGMSPHMYTRHRALSYEWDPRHQGVMSNGAQATVDERRALHTRSMEWTNNGFGYPAEVLMPEHQREVISINVGEDGSEESVQKPPPYDDEDDDHHSVSQAPTDCSTFV